MRKTRVRLHRVDLLQVFDHCGGVMYSAPILLDGDTGDEPLKSKLVMFEDGRPLRRAHEQHSAIAGTGRGAYSHWMRHVFFSASDNSDPNTNGRVYSFAVDHFDQHEPQDNGRVFLPSPFHPQGGSCWGVAVSDEGDNVTSGPCSKLKLYEDERPLGPGHALHFDIVQTGAGAYSHWMMYLYFSTSDGSDPNTNRRLYSYEITD